MKIYLAGQITPNCWRHEVVKGLHTARVDGVSDWQPLRRAIFGQHDYVGPFYSDSDDLRRGQAAYRRRCMDAICNADLVFAWFGSETDVPNLLFEIGYATALGKIVRVSKEYEFETEPFWMAVGLNGCPDVSTEPYSALRYAVNSLKGCVSAFQLLCRSILRLKKAVGQDAAIQLYKSLRLPLFLQPETLAVNTEAFDYARTRHIYDTADKVANEAARAAKSQYWKSVEEQGLMG